MFRGSQAFRLKNLGFRAKFFTKKYFQIGNLEYKVKITIKLIQPSDTKINDKLKETQLNNFWCDHNI